jgi:hypothetical protein
MAKPRLETTEKTTISDVLKATKNHADWLVITRFGLSSLLDEQSYLLSLISKEAGEEVKRVPGVTLDQAFAQIMSELGLKVQLTA